MIKRPILTNKEDINFNEALKLYDSKQYRKSLKLIEAILKKNSHHAESLALKGCINFQLNYKSEAEPYIVKALAKAADNYVVNHLAGIYYKAVDNYGLAAKYFGLAIDNGSTNKQLLRELSSFQAQIRDYKNLKDSRQKYLEFQPGYRANWTGSAIALHLNKNYNGAYSTLTKIEEIIKDHLQENDMYEQSECYLYKNDILFQAGNVTKALSDLEANEPYIKDKLSVMEYKAQYLMILGRNQEASLLYRRLIQRNPDNVEYYKKLEITLCVTDLDLKLKLYEKLATFYPRADPPEFLPLVFLPSTHQQFATKAQHYVTSQLKRGVPATFVNIKPLLKNPKKLAIIENTVNDFLSQVDGFENPTIKLWTLYFLAQLHLYKNEFVVSLKYIELAIDHSPTLVDLYLFKARVLKHLGDLSEAAEVMEQGRQLDLQDRFVNSKATKYYLRADNIDKAMDLISLFTKMDANAVNGCKELHIMQANWFLVESAEAYVRLYRKYQEKLSHLQETSMPESEVENESKEIDDIKEKIEIHRGLALKRFHAVIKIFKTFYNDQFDFHVYCLRRGTPRDYIKLLKWEDQIHRTPIYIRVLKGLSSIYLEIYQHQLANKPETDFKVKKNNKKAKRAKAQLMKQKEALIAKVESETDDPDPLGIKLVSDLENNAHGTIIDNLWDLVEPLTNEAKDIQFTWRISFKLNLIKQKYILCLQALKNIKGTNVDELVGQLNNTIENDTTANEAIKKVVEKSLAAL